MLTEHNHRPDRKRDRKYLLAGLVKCTACGHAFTGDSTRARGKKYHYYRCGRRTQKSLPKGPPHRTAYLSAEWLEDLVWQDVKRFLENPGEILKHVSEQLRSNDDTEELSRRRESLAKRLATKQSEKDRYVRLYAQGHISEAELETYLADLKNQTDNLRLLIASVETELSQKREHTELAQTTHAWLATLRERINEVEEDTQEAFRVRRQLVRLLVEIVTVGEKREDANTEVRITYRFDPPDRWDNEEDSVAGGVLNPPRQRITKHATIGDFTELSAEGSREQLKALRMVLEGYPQIGDRGTRRCGQSPDSQTKTFSSRALFLWLCLRSLTCSSPGGASHLSMTGLRSPTVDASWRGRFLTATSSSYVPSSLPCSIHPLFSSVATTLSGYLVSLYGSSSRVLVGPGCAS